MTGAAVPTVDVPQGPEQRYKGSRSKGASWSMRDRVGLGFAWFLGLLFLAITASIVLYMMVQGLRYIQPELFVTSPAAGFSESESGGFLDPLLGTIIVATMGMAIAFPVGVGVAVWLSEFGRPAWLSRVIESTVEMLAGSPSIVFALFGVLIFEQGALSFLSRVNEGVTLGRSFFAASAMLSLVALPLVVANVREGLQAIPGHVREASYAVGKTKWATTLRVLLPAARPSAVTGAMLGVGRIIGDTAIIVLLLGATLRFNETESIPILSTLQGTGSTLTSYVYANAPTGEANQPTKAFAAGFVLLSMVLVLNFMVDIAVRRGRKWH